MVVAEFDVVQGMKIVEAERKARRDVKKSLPQVEMLDLSHCPQTVSRLSKIPLVPPQWVQNSEFRVG
jgi:hypothetical protein